MNNKIKVLVVDDSSLFRQALIQHLSSQPGIEVIGYAINAYDAKQKIPQLKPDVLTLDVEMPGLNGIEFLKQLLPTTPLPVVLVSSLNLSVFDALSAGAVDFVRKPDMSVRNSKQTFFESLTVKVMTAAKAKVRITPPGHLVGSAADTAGLYLKARHDIFHCLVEHFERIAPGLLTDNIESTIYDLLRHTLLAVKHDRVDQLGDKLGIVKRVGQNVSLRNVSSSWHFTSLLH